MVATTRTTPRHSVPQQLLDDAQTLLARCGATDEGFQAIGSLLRSLARRPEITGLIEAHEPYALIFDSLVLASHDLGPTLILRRIPSGRPTPEPVGLSWGIACVVKGRNRFTTWRKDRPDGDLVRVGEVDLTPGDFVYFHVPPRNFHSEQGIGGPSWELVLSGQHLTARDDIAFDVAGDQLELAS